MFSHLEITLALELGASHLTYLKLHPTSLTGVCRSVFYWKYISFCICGHWLGFKGFEMASLLQYLLLLFLLRVENMQAKSDCITCFTPGMEGVLPRGSGQKMWVSDAMWYPQMICSVYWELCRCRNCCLVQIRRKAEWVEIVLIKYYRYYNIYRVFFFSCQNVPILVLEKFLMTWHWVHKQGEYTEVAGQRARLGEGGRTTTRWSIKKTDLRGKSVRNIRYFTFYILHFSSGV